MQFQYIISLTLKDDAELEKVYIVNGVDKKNIEERLDDCLQFESRIKQWKIKEEKMIQSNSDSSDENKMYGTWYEPF